jgi:cytochrome b subunit of formate dehydrogenase
MPFTQNIPIIKKKILTEAQALGYTFVLSGKLAEKNTTRDITAGCVEILPDTVVFNLESGPIRLKYKNIDVQVLARSQKAYVGLCPRPHLIEILLVGYIVMGFMILIFNKQLISIIANIAYAGIAMVVSGYLIGIWVWIRNRLANRQDQIESVAACSTIYQKLDEASDEEKYFRRLIQVNLRNMEQYYQLVRRQTEKSFLMTTAIAVAGFVILCSGIVMEYAAPSKSLNLTLLTMASGTLIEFISAVCFYLYNRTIQQLNAYHDKLVDVQDTMLALKVAQIVKQEDLKDRTMAFLTRALTRRIADHHDQRQLDGDRDEKTVAVAAMARQDRQFLSDTPH